MAAPETVPSMNTVVIFMAPTIGFRLRGGYWTNALGLWSNYPETDAA